VASAAPAELVFVIDVSALTAKGFTGSTEYEGKKVDLDFDDADAGVFLNSEMAGRLHVKKGSRVSVVIEDDDHKVTEIRVASVGSSLRISDSRVYYAVGREGGAVIRLRKG
jgi:ABC-type lipoprotein release transport system permease subunit